MNLGVVFAWIELGGSFGLLILAIIQLRRQSVSLKKSLQAGAMFYSLLQLIGVPCRLFRYAPWQFTVVARGLEHAVILISAVYIIFNILRARLATLSLQKKVPLRLRFVYFALGIICFLSQAITAICTLSVASQASYAWSHIFFSASCFFVGIHLIISLYRLLKVLPELEKPARLRSQSQSHKSKGQDEGYRSDNQISRRHSLVFIPSQAHSRQDSIVTACSTTLWKPANHNGAKEHKTPDYNRRISRAEEVADLEAIRRQSMPSEIVCQNPNVGIEIDPRRSNSFKSLADLMHTGCFNPLDTKSARPSTDPTETASSGLSQTLYASHSHKISSDSKASRSRVSFSSNRTSLGVFGLSPVRVRGASPPGPGRPKTLKKDSLCPTKSSSPSASEAPEYKLPASIGSVQKDAQSPINKFGIALQKLKEMKSSTTGGTTVKPPPSKVSEWVLRAERAYKDKAFPASNYKGKSKKQRSRRASIGSRVALRSYHNRRKLRAKMQLTVVVCFVLSISMTVLSAVVGADILVSDKSVNNTSDHQMFSVSEAVNQIVKILTVFSFIGYAWQVRPDPSQVLLSRVVISDSALFANRGSRRRRPGTAGRHSTAGRKSSTMIVLEGMQEASKAKPNVKQQLAKNTENPPKE
ncbi:hypothetical protein AAMO2058_001096900 [Amorphochlora amoebiformis]